MMVANLTSPPSVVDYGISCKENVFIGVIVLGVPKPGITLLRLGFRGMMNIYSSERDVVRERHCIAKAGTPWPAVRLLVHQVHHLPVLKTHREK